jgi:hypothetical protein
MPGACLDSPTVGTSTRPLCADKAVLSGICSDPDRFRTDSVSSEHRLPSYEQLRAPSGRPVTGGAWVLHATPHPPASMAVYLTYAVGRPSLLASESSCSDLVPASFSIPCPLRPWLAGQPVSHLLGQAQHLDGLNVGITAWRGPFPHRRRSRGPPITMTPNSTAGRSRRPRNDPADRVQRGRPTRARRVITDR